MWLKEDLSPEKWANAPESTIHSSPPCTLSASKVASRSSSEGRSGGYDPLDSLFSKFTPCGVVWWLAVEGVARDQWLTSTRKASLTLWRWDQSWYHAQRGRVSGFLAAMTEKFLWGQRSYLVARIALGSKVLSMMLRCKSPPDNVSDSHYERLLRILITLPHLEVLLHLEPSMKLL